ncbi:MAG: pilin [Candidatus Saccharimonadales bacterium]
MIQKIRTTLLSLMAVMAFAAAPALVAAPAYAAPNVTDSLCSGANLEIGGSTDCATEEGVATDKVNSIITNVINIFSAVVGIAAVLMIIYGGFRYITSGGDSGKVSSAKNTIIYAVIGLVIVALAQFIVKFVLDKTVTPA